MARPTKDGIEYFSLDIDLFSDNKIKLIRSEFGAKGLVVFIYLLCEIYRTDGYYMDWDNDSPMLASEGAACGCNPDFISQVVRRLIKRSLFNEKLFDSHHILTSTGIQRRYLRACSARDEIRIKQEYWLLDVTNKKDVPSGILKKITFINETLQNNSVNLQINSQSLQNYPQSKVKESKEKESRESGAYAPTPSLENVKAFCSEKGLRIDPERFFNYYEGNGWTTSAGQPIKDWKAVARNWNKTEKGKSEPKRDTTYDIEEIEQLNAFS